MVPSYQHFLVSSWPAWPLIINLNLNETKSLSLLGSLMCQQYLNMFHLYIFIKKPHMFSNNYYYILSNYYQLFWYDRRLLLFQCFQCPIAFVLKVDGWFRVSSNRFTVLLLFDVLLSYYYINISFELLHQFHCFLFVCNCP